MPNETRQTTPKPEVPAWVTKTPHETAYSLTLWSDEGGGDDINITRAEYIALKLHLAKMRGFDVVPETDAATAPAEAKPDKPETFDFTNLTTHETEYLGTCLEIHRNARGCDTPAEDLITDLVGCYRVHKGGVSPVDVERCVKTFADSFPDAIEAARHLLRQYPDLVTTEPDEASEAA